MNSIILIGPPGSGKSTVGQLLATDLNRPFLDTDQMIEEGAGKTIAEIFVDQGESTFREWEASAVEEALSSNGSVISLGGGAVMTESVSTMLRESKDFIAYLEVGIASAAPRIGFNRDRPLLLVNPRQQWLSLFEKRRPIYENLSHFTISTDESEPIEVARAIAQAWRSYSEAH